MRETIKTKTLSSLARALRLLSESEIWNKTQHYANKWAVPYLGGTVVSVSPQLLRAKHLCFSLRM